MDPDRPEEPQRRYFVPAPQAPSSPPTSSLPSAPPSVGGGPPVAPAAPQAWVDAGPAPVAAPTPWHPEAAPRGTDARAPGARPRRERPRRIGIVASLLLLASAFAAVPALTVVWTRSALRDAGTWRSTFGPLHEDRQLAASLGELIADTYDTGNVPREQVVAAAQLAITSELFGTAWEGALVEVHGQAMAVVDGDRSDAVTLDLSPVIDQLEATGLIASGSQDGRRTVPLIGAGDTDQLRAGSRLLDRVAFVLPAVALVLAALGLLLARNRWKALTLLGAVIAVVAVVSALVTGFVPGAIIDALVSQPARGAARPAADAVGDRLASALWLTAALAGAAAVAGIVADRIRP